MSTKTVTMDHGGGGKASRDLIQSFFLPKFFNPFLGQMDDSAVMEVPGGRVAFTTDGYVVDPIFFPGGSIGSLAIHGTVNDLAVQGARPLFISAGFILEEGLLLDDLERILAAMADAAREASVLIVAGDTKVVPHGKADKIFITTAGVGTIPAGVYVSGSNARVGDRIIVSGTLGDHGITLLSQREGLEFQTALRSDSAPLNHLIQGVLAATQNVHAMRDPTRGGLAASLNEIASQSRAGIVLQENALPIKDAVRAACEVLGLDPLYIANEGKVVICVAPPDERTVLDRIRAHPYGKDAALIGEVTDEHPGRVVLRTAIGGKRILDLPTGELLPRIC